MDNSVHMNLSNAYDIILVVAGIVLTGLSAWDLIKNWVEFGWPKRIRDGVGVLGGLIVVVATYLSSAQTSLRADDMQLHIDAEQKQLSNQSLQIGGLRLASNRGTSVSNRARS